MGLKSRIRQYLSDKLGVTENRTLIQGLSSYITLLGGDSIVLPLGIDLEVKKGLQSKHNIKDFVSTIHRNDVMLYNHVIHYGGDTAQAVESYFQVGVELVKRIHQAIDGDSSAILDFGSGYGRMSRFLPSYYPQSTISVSEVKPLAMQFQKEVFGFNTYVHTEGAETLQTPKQNLIIAISVFTHLPLKACQGWINHLCDLLTDGGSLFLTFNALDKCPFENNGAFHYEMQSEDSTESGIPDKLNDVQKYGSTYFSEEALRGLVKNTALELAFHKDFIGTHDALIITKH